MVLQFTETIDFRILFGSSYIRWKQWQSPQTPVKSRFCGCCASDKKTILISEIIVSLLLLMFDSYYGTSWSMTILKKIIYKHTLTHTHPNTPIHANTYIGIIHMNTYCRVKYNKNNWHVCMYPINSIYYILYTN